MMFTTERKIKVVLELTLPFNIEIIPGKVCPAELDVGIMESYVEEIEIDSVEIEEDMLDYSIADIVKQIEKQLLDAVKAINAGNPQTVIDDSDLIGLLREQMIIYANENLDD